MMFFDVEGPEFLDFESCFNVVNSNCYTHMLQKLHSKIKNKCSGQVTDIILPHDRQFPCGPEFRTSWMLCIVTYSLCSAYSLGILSFDFYVFRPKSSKNMHLYHAVGSRKQFFSDFWSSPWDCMDQVHWLHCQWYSCLNDCNFFFILLQ